MAFALAPSLASTNGHFEPIVGRDPASARVQPTPVPIGGGDDEIVVRSAPRAEHDPNRSVRAPTNPAVTGPPRVSMPQAPNSSAAQPSRLASDDDAWPAPSNPTGTSHDGEPTTSEHPRPEPTRSAPTAAPTTQVPTVKPTTPTKQPTTGPTSGPTQPEVPIPGSPVISPSNGSQICNDADTYTISYSATNATEYSVQIDGKEQRTKATSVTVTCPNPQAQDSYVAVTVAGLNANPKGGPFASVQLVVKAPLGGGPSEAPSTPPSTTAAAPTITPQDVTSPTTPSPDAAESPENPGASPTP